MAGSCIEMHSKLDSKLDRQRQTETDRDRQRQSDTEIHTETHTEIHTEIDTEIHTEIDTEIHTELHRCRDIFIQTWAGRGKQLYTYSAIHAHTESD